MLIKLCQVVCILLLTMMTTHGQNLTTLYEYYTTGGITEGLKAPNTGFTLNGKPIKIYSGAIHYFRVHPNYWRDRLRKARAAGLNAVETYAPWNLHEPKKGEYDFGNRGNDLSMLLDVRRFIEMAKEEDLFVLFRPGPYICSEWEFGGLPSWLLRYEGIKVRTSDPIFKSHVTYYFNTLLQQVADLTFMNGGPIIALQIENEYGSFGAKNESRDIPYLEFIRDLYKSNNLNELYFTSDSATNSGTIGACPGELMTANFARNAQAEFDELLRIQPDKALMAMEFWTGWFDHWMQGYHDSGNSPQVFRDVLTEIFSYNASVNFYMFHGGLTHGFMNGANVKDSFPFYESDVSSYDYGAPLTEAGDYTEKYYILKELIDIDNPIKTIIPAMPTESVKVVYPSAPITHFISSTDLFNQIPAEDKILVNAINVNSSMENLNINNNNGQSYGYTIYKKIINVDSNSSTLKITGHVRDIAQVLIDGVQRTSRPNGTTSLLGFGYWPANDAEFLLTDLTPGQDHLLEILVENFARNNFGWPEDFDQKKGLWEGAVFMDNIELTDWEVSALQFKGAWANNLTDWQPITGGNTISGPVVLKTTFNIPGEPQDTFLDMNDWSKGIIFINGFPLGRYFYLGPQITSYVPAPLLRQGQNEIILFEQYNSALEVKFTTLANLGKLKKKKNKKINTQV